MNPDDEMDITVVAVDGHDAICAVVVRRVDGVPGAFDVKASANGITKAQMSRILRDIADKWADE
jgi:hypothetical protein